MKQNWIVIIILLLLSFCLWGCGKTDGPLSPTKAYAEEATAETTTPTPSATPTPDPIEKEFVDIKKCSHDVLFAGGYIWASNLSWGTITKVDPTTNSVVGTVYDAPNVHALTFDGTYLWGLCRTGRLKKVDMSSCSVIGEIFVDWTPQGACFDGSYIWTGPDQTGCNVIQKVNLNKNTVETTVTTNGDAAHDFAFDGTNVWVSNYFARSVSKIDPIANVAICTIPTGENPDRLFFGAGYLWVSNKYSHNVCKIDVNTNQIVGKIQFEGGTFPNEMTFDGTYLYVSKEGRCQVAKVDPNSCTVVRTFPLPRPALSNTYPRGMAFDGQFIWVGVSFGNYLYKISKD